MTVSIPTDAGANELRFANVSSNSGEPLLAHSSKCRALETPERASGYFTTRADSHPRLNARTAGAYWRANPEDMSIVDGRDDRKRAELIAERLRQWKSLTNA